MADDEIVITLGRDQALVLSDWLHRSMGTEHFDSLVNADRAVWSPLYSISGTLETSLAEVFARDYGVRVATARQNLIAAGTRARWGRRADEDQARQNL